MHAKVLHTFAHMAVPSQGHQAVGVLHAEKAASGFRVCAFEQAAWTDSVLVMCCWQHVGEVVAAGCGGLSMVAWGAGGGSC